MSYMPYISHRLNWSRRFLGATCHIGGWVSLVPYGCFGHMSPRHFMGAIEPMRDMGLIGTIGNINPTCAIHMGS